MFEMLSIPNVSKFAASRDFINHSKNSTISAGEYASHAGTLEPRMDSIPGSVTSKTGRGAVFISGVLPEPGAPNTTDFTPYRRASCDAGLS